MAIVSKKYTHSDRYVDQEFKSLIDQLNRHLQGKILNKDQIPVGLNAYNIPQDLTANRSLDEVYENSRNSDQGRWVFIVVDLNATVAANATAEAQLLIGYVEPNLSLGSPKIVAGQNQRQVTILGWIPNRYKYTVTSDVTNGGVVTLISWVEVDWKY